MSLQTRLDSLVFRLASEFKTLYGQMGALANLSTTDKTNLVASINELRHQITSLSAIVVIDDAQPESTITTLSAAKISDLLDALKIDLTDGTEAALDTLKELQSTLLDDQSGIEAILTAVNKRVRFDAQQSLSAAEQAQARQNIGVASLVQIGDPDTDFVAVFEQALAG